MTVERLENEMSADELDDWIEFYRLEPFGDEERMADKRNGLLCSISINSSMAGGDTKPSDFEFYERTIPLKEEEDTADWEAKLLKAMTTI